MSKIENPPAFPSHAGDPEMTDPRNRISCGGMTLCDWFAGQVSPQVYWGVNTEPSFKEQTPQQLANAVAKISYMMADAMLTARFILESQAATALESAQARIAELEAELVEAKALLAECPKWLVCLDSHASGSTTDLLIDRINAALKEPRHD